jgi:hypothetical protein
MRKMIFPLLLLLPLAIFYSNAVSAEEGSHSGEVQKCFKCHGHRGIVKKFQNGEFVAAYVNPKRFGTSAHAHMPCSTCHGDFSADKHPNRVFESKEQYRIRATLVCRRCHSNDQLRAKPVHDTLLKEYSEGTPLVCTDCHDSHSTLPVKGGKILSSEKEYCLNCHSGPLRLDFRDGEQLTLAVEPSALEASVHHDLSCSDCHFGFSSKEHPRRNFRTKRDFVIANSESCRRCHFDKYTKTMESIHYALLNQGNLAAPVCTDCHGSHSVGQGRVEKVASGKRCKKCHEDIWDIYAKSVHGEALLDEHNQDVPICVDCHKAHEISNPRTTEYRERIPEMCGNCHSNRQVVGKYGLSTDVVKSYLCNFHGVTVGYYRKEKEVYKPDKPIAVCTDCHGIHNITKTTGPDATIIKANLAKRCQRCHKNATNNFPDAWLPHYVPSLKKAPLVFIINFIYDILMPVMIIGLLLQILLHIWRYAINR